MAEQLWGFQGGWNAETDARQSQQMAAYQLQEAPIKIQSEQLGVKEAGIELEKSALQLQQLKRFNEMLDKQQPAQGGAQGGSQIDQMHSQVEAQASQLDSIGQMYISSGLPKEGEAALKTASELRKNQSLIDQRVDKHQDKIVTMLGGLLDHVHDQQSWQQANAMYEMEAGEPSPYKDKPYSPELVDALKQGLQTHKDQALTKAAEARTRASNAEADTLAVRKNLIRAQTQLATDRAAALEKAGGGALVPKKEDLDAVVEHINKLYGNVLSPSDQRLYGRPIADRVVELMHSGMPRSAAAKKAFDEARANGQFEGLRQGAPERGTAEAPIKLTSSTTAKELVPNQYYLNSKGEVALWTGSEFQAPKQAIGDDGVGEDEEGDDDAE